MLVREGDARNDTIDKTLASCLAAVAGALNAAAFYAVGFFSANMTGNVSSLSSQVALGHGGAALFYGAVVAAFVLGAATSTLIINEGRRRDVRKIYAHVIVAEASFLSILAAVELWSSIALRPPILVLGLAFTMGLQNAVVTRISGARIRTTHVSGMATDIGIEIATAIDIVRGHTSGSEAKANYEKLGLHLYTVGSFILGGAIGVWAYLMIGDFLLFLCSATLFAVAGFGSRHVSNGSRE